MFSDHDVKIFKGKENNILAILIPNEHHSEGIEFITDNSEYQQVAVMHHTKGHIITPHFHNKIYREVYYTNETLIIKKGILRVFLFESNEVVYNFEIKKGDIITLLSGGHGFEVIEDVDMVEIKQGPYLGDIDKTRF